MMDRLSEFNLIEQIRRNSSVRDGVKVGIGDDAAVLVRLQRPVVTTDCLVEDIHFRWQWTSPRALGRKSIAVNVSDIAAMGARPVAAFVTIALASDVNDAQVKELMQGMEDAAEQYALTIAGGDTSRSPGASMISVTVVGDCVAAPLLRSGAKPGDKVLLSGTVGDSAAGLEILKRGEPDSPDSCHQYLLNRHREPTARSKEMMSLVTTCRNAITAAIDISDGLAADAGHVAKASEVGIEIEAEKIPISNACRDYAKQIDTHHTDWARDWSISGGEDYEILICVEAEQEAKVLLAAKELGIALTQIGQCVADEDCSVRVLNADGIETNAPSGFRHF